MSDYTMRELATIAGYLRHEPLWRLAWTFVRLRWVWSRKTWDRLAARPGWEGMRGRGHRAPPKPCECGEQPRRIA